jgi:hypothetical protein
MEEPTGAVHAALGLATLLAAILPRLLRRVPISLPMVFLAAGALVFALIPELPDPDPRTSSVFTVRVTELCVIVSLMGAGLALNRPVGWRRWATTWRLLAFTMPLSMLGAGLLGWGFLGLGVAAAILLAAAVAPTDPVLATEVQVAEPVEELDRVDDEVGSPFLDSELLGCNEFRQPSRAGDSGRSPRVTPWTPRYPGRAFAARREIPASPGRGVYPPWWAAHAARRSNRAEENTHVR